MNLEVGSKADRKRSLAEKADQKFLGTSPETVEEQLLEEEVLQEVPEFEEVSIPLQTQELLEALGSQALAPVALPQENKLFSPELSKSSSL